MSRAVSKKQKKFNTNSKPLLEIIWKEMPCLENIWRINRCAKSIDMIVSWTEIKIACLISQSTIIKIVSNSEDDKSFSMKSIEIEFHGHSEIENCLRDL